MRQTIRDALWLWGHEAGSHDGQYGLPGSSRITPVEAAHYMGIPNVIMVRYGSRTPPPDRQAAVPFRSLREVVWSVVGAGGTTGSAEIDQVLRLPACLPAMTGVMMDDFFHPEQNGECGVLPVAQLRELRARLAVAGGRRARAAGKPLDLWVVLYAHQLELPVREHLALCDVVTFWTWKACDLAHLERNVAAWEALVPRSRRVLGCYMWDYGQSRPLPLAQMQRQCELGLQWLRQGRVHGLIFLASCICDLELETTEWTRDWIARVADEPLADQGRATEPCRAG